MDLAKLYQILDETTTEYRKGAVMEGTPELVKAVQNGDEELPGGVLEIFAMPPVSEAQAGTEMVDVVFEQIGVNTSLASAKKADLIGLLDTYPQPDRLAGGPSYIEVGAEIGSQSAAFRLFALGKVLGLWEIITPETMGMKGAEARELAGMGFIMITGYRAVPAREEERA